MFRDGQYLEVIKASDDCLATAVVTVQERTVEIEKRKVVTNKWLRVEDWAALYRILERAILRNGRQDGGPRREGRPREWRKSTRQLEVTYTFENPESASDTSSLPTIKVHVSPARKKAVKREVADDETPKRSKVKTGDDATPKRGKEERSPVRTTTKGDQAKRTPEKSARLSPGRTEAPSAAATAGQGDLKRKKFRTYTLSDDLENAPLEEYIPDAPRAKRSCPDFKYVPSRKSALESMRLTSNEYTPTLCDGKVRAAEGVSYVPNSVEKPEANHEIYEPRAITAVPDGVFEEYVPNSKGLNSSVEEYEPDFRSPSKLTKFDDSYVPSSVARRSAPDDSKRAPGKDKPKAQRPEACRKGTVDKKKIDYLFS
ncbi:PREDICTED: uncharacterized protein LOC105569759 [Vollenhovia emeryi]|uniref:uncharacterized protein LOC105569759 n=1 Tax=Vollenhovia emeryi TaxID=411798 RepID=UPI0005F57930|nr:PREDICTED: uncharacterized protein LOC105569759 [Vollenhovia emeryi]